MLLQAYDFLHLFDAFGCRLQLGGSDQWGNITMGIDLVRKVRQQEVWGLTTPLVVKADGTKFGKTESGTVWLDPERTSPYQLYQFFLRSEDAVVGTYLRYFTFLDHDAILALDEATAGPSRAPRGPPRAGPPGVHPGARRPGDRAGRAGRRRPVRRGGEPAGRAVDPRRLRRRPVDDASPGPPRRRGCTTGRPAVETELAPSRGRARTTIEQGGAYLNNRRVEDVGRAVGSDDLVAGRYVVLRSAGSATTTWCRSPDPAAGRTGAPDPTVLH